MDRYHEIGLALARPLLSSAPSRRGVLLGRITLVDIVRIEDVPGDQREWAFGPWCFVLKDPISFANPVPWKGERGFFDVPDEAMKVQPCAGSKPI